MSLYRLSLPFCKMGTYAAYLLVGMLSLLGDGLVSGVQTTSMEPWG